MFGITSEIPCGPSSEINCCYHCTDIFLFNSNLRIVMRKSDKLLHIVSIRLYIYSAEHSCKVILMTFFMFVYKFRMSSLNRFDPSTLSPFYLTMSISCTSRHRNTNPPAETRISTDGNHANYARKTRETDENLKRNERCEYPNTILAA